MLLAYFFTLLTYDKVNKTLWGNIKIFAVEMLTDIVIHKYLDFSENYPQVRASKMKMSIRTFVLMHKLWITCV